MSPVGDLIDTHIGWAQKNAGAAEYFDATGRHPSNCPGVIRKADSYGTGICDKCDLRLAPRPDSAPPLSDSPMNF
jgi:hypothetical protein